MEIYKVTTYQGKYTEDTYYKKLNDAHKHYQGAIIEYKEELAKYNEKTNLVFFENDGYFSCCDKGLEIVDVATIVKIEVK